MERLQKGGVNSSYCILCCHWQQKAASLGWENRDQRRRGRERGRGRVALLLGLKNLDFNGQIIPKLGLAKRHGGRGPGGFPLVAGICSLQVNLN